MNERILIAEDNPDMRDLLQEVLEDAGYTTIIAADGHQAMTHVDRYNQMIDLLITDVRMPGLSGDQLLAAVRERRGETAVIVITAFGSVEQAVAMVKAGAFQYLTKPFKNIDLLGVVAEALQQTAPQRRLARLRRESSGTPAKIIGASRPMRKLYEQIGVAAACNSTVLITGESGTGKELVARAIHEMSGRKGAFVPVNCSAIPAELIEAELFGHTGSAFTGARQARAGLFEAADEGTIFLDEIGELTPPMQPKLLRVLQDGAVRRVGANAERHIDVRVVAATNSNLEEEVRQERFREDLFWRLNVIHLRTPALRDRATDIPLLAEHFVEKCCQAADRQVLQLAPETLAILTAYRWPGNVRELENAIERAVAFSQGAILLPDSLPERIRAMGGTAVLVARAGEKTLTMREVEREYILEILHRTGGNKKRTAELLGLDRKTLYRKLDEYRTEDPSLEV